MAWDDTSSSSDASASAPVTVDANGPTSLHEAQQLFQATFEQAAVGIAHVNLQGQWLRVNQKLCDILGYSPDELLQLTFQDITYPADLHTDLKYVGQLLAGKLSTYSMEKRYLRRDRSTVWANLSVSLVLDEAGRPQYFISIVQDISRRKQAEEAYRRQEELFRASVETMLDSFGIYTALRDADGQIVDFRIEYVNQAACDNNRMTREEQIGRGLLEILPAHRDIGLFDDYCRVVETGQPLAREMLLYSDVYNGQQLDRAFDIRVTKLGDGFAAAWRDVTERKRAEVEREQLLAGERAARIQAEEAIDRITRLQKVMTLLAASVTPQEVADVILSEGINALGAVAGTIALLTPDAQNLEVLHAVGYPVEVMEQWRRFPADTSTPLGEAAALGRLVLLPSRVEAKEDYPILPIIDRLGDGALCAAPLTSHGRVIGALGLSFRGPYEFGRADEEFMLSLVQQCAYALDRAALYASEQHAGAEAQEAVRVREAFFSVASHELKNPLTVVLGNAQLLERYCAADPNMPERAQRLSRVIFNQATRLDKMISALLDTSRIERGTLTLQRGPVDLSALTRRLVTETQPSHLRHRLTWAGPDEPLVIDGDELRLEQVLTNLLSNAVKYSPKGGAVTVRLERQGDEAVVSVADQGIGIPTDALPALFRRFGRIQNAEDLHITGLGLGLFVVKEIVTLHGGQVGVESVEGQGSVFTVRLPLARAGG